MSKDNIITPGVKRGVIYARYSAGPHQTEQSIEGQVRECTQYARNNGITIVGEYIDRKISGTTDNRENFLRMMADSKLHLFDVVITYKTDRFSRNRYDAAVYKRELRQNGVEIVYSSENIPDGPEGIILESLLEGLAEYYSAELRQKIVRGMHESALKGKALGTMPVGYRKSADGKYEINPEQAPVVKMIFEKYIAGEKMKDIAQTAYTMGLRTRHGSPVAPARLAEMLCNEKYIGVYNAYGVRIEGGIPAIIDKETFYLAQKRKEYNRHHGSERGGRATAHVDYLLSGKAYCGICGQPLVGYSGTSRSGEMYRYYACRGRVRKRCRLKFLPKESLEKVVARETRQRVLQPDVISSIVNAYVQLKDNTDENALKRKQLKQAIKRTENEIDNIISAIASGLLSESLKSRLLQLEEEKTKLNIELTEYKDRPRITRQQVQFLLTQAGRAEGEEEKNYRKRLLDIFVQTVLVYDNKLVVTYNLQDNNSEPVFSVKDYTALETAVADMAMRNCSIGEKCSP